MQAGSTVYLDECYFTFSNFPPPVPIPRTLVFGAS